MLGLKRFLLADEQSFVPRSLASTDGACGHTGSSANPPTTSLFRERMTLEPTEHSGVAQECAHDRPLLAQSGRSEDVCSWGQTINRSPHWQEGAAATG